ncbi:unnamed protein product [Brassica rapa]|uniref:Uncharacterized protein n=1 Tax=Brassica campestris TaxID=3711 RepID=A0A8D9LZL8_BRACM|nr:unnamed protein product [Brassica rapa]
MVCCRKLLNQRSSLFDLACKAGLSWTSMFEAGFIFAKL